MAICRSASCHKQEEEEEEEELDVGRLCSSVVRAVDQKSKDLGSSHSAVESVFSSTERFSNSLCIYNINKN